MYCAYVRSISVYVLCTPSKRSLTKKTVTFVAVTPGFESRRDQIRPKQVFSAKFDQNHIVQAENRKMKTAKLIPKRDKQTPFSSVLIPSPVRGCDSVLG